MDSLILLKRFKKILFPLWKLTPWYLLGEMKRLNEKCDDLEFLSKNQFLSQISGVIHVGASVGQERYLYDFFGLEVLWIEPIPDVYSKLNNNIKSFPKQIAINELITDVDNQIFNFNIATNSGASSSLYEINLHSKIWPEVKMNKKMRIKSKTLETIFKENGIDISKYQALIMDTQGSELLVLKGCKSLLKNFEFIKTEVADFDSYANCCQLKDIEQFMSENNYFLYSKSLFAYQKEVGSYYDLTYKKN